MIKWKASMPREKAKAGSANVVLAYRTSTGLRFEFDGELPEEDARALIDQAIQMMKNNKE